MSYLRKVLPGVGLCLVLMGLGRGLFAPLSASSHVEQPGIDFDRQIAPLLAERCLDCHSGSKPRGGLDLSRKAAVFRGGKNGPALVPGKPDQSSIWERVQANEMPPKKPLSREEQARLKQWIESGAVWGSDPIDPFRITTRTRAGTDWWSLQPLQAASPPSVKNNAWIRNPIDAFILARLEAKNLQPSPEADRRTLIRRLSFDLLGLPPTPEMVKSFIVSQEPDAYEKLVDQLLASPHYGERWARHWLDIVHYGESDGFERNGPRLNSWPYRDWVIDAFNRDLPYTDFCRLQIAGDILQPGNAEATIATGFLVAGIHNTVIPGNKLAMDQAFQDELEELVGTVGQTFLGLTVNCARCHDHKFDPIAQVDYYRLAATLSGVRHGEREIVSRVGQDDLARLKKEAEDLEKTLKDLEEPARKQILASRTSGKRYVPISPTPIAAWDFRTGGKDRLGNLHVKEFEGAHFTTEGLVLDGKVGVARSEPLLRDMREKTLEVWVRLPRLDQSGGGAMSLESLDGGTFDAIVYAEREPRRWMAGSNGFVRTSSFQAVDEKEADQQTIVVAITYAADGTIRGFRNGQPYGKAYQSNGPVVFAAGKSQVIFGLRHEPIGGNRMLAGTIVQARLYDRALTAEEIAISGGGGEYVSEAELTARLEPDQRRQREATLQRLAAMGTERARLVARQSMRVYTNQSSQPEVTHVLLRGQTTSPAEVVSPSGIRSVASTATDFGLKPDAREADRRRKLAAWITAIDNPLFHRVIVNRLWHYHFGTGIVESPNDFGFNGGRPSHPELLDWLAIQLRQKEYSLKAIHRLIVTSATYRQSSKSRPEAREIDADSRFLWRKRPLRIEGEVLRDSLLQISGLLNPAAGGPSFTDYKQTGGAGTEYFDPIDPVGLQYHRRSIYRFLPRGANPGLLDVFDCPDPASAAPRRNLTTTPLQALSLWNGAFALRMASNLAERIAREATGPDLQIRRLYQLLYQRDPAPEERTAARALVDQHGLKVLCRALCNTNEFLTVE